MLGGVVNGGGSKECQGRKYAQHTNRFGVVRVACIDEIAKAN
jgi:hypothetical protein